MLSKRPSTDDPTICLAIQEFNRECAQERTKRPTQAQPRRVKRIQNYDIYMDRLVGSGTFSQVYKATDTQREAVVAVKVVELRKIEEMKIHDLFWEELKIIKRLRHPNIVTCMEYFRTVNNCYSVYEYCEGGDLTLLLRKGSLGDRQTLAQANKIIRDVYRGLLYLESVNVVHRDIKAANILLCKGRAKIGDFGFATKCNREFKDASIGSPAYMAPEALVHNIYGPKTDVWGFGMLLYEILHGESPYANCQSEAELKNKVQVPISWDQLKGSLPSSLKRLILKCLQVDFLHRPNFSELKNDEYLVKIQRDEELNKPMTKSNHTSETSESDGLPKSARLIKKSPPISPGRGQKLSKQEEQIDQPVLTKGQSLMDLPYSKKESVSEMTEEVTNAEEGEERMAQSSWNLERPPSPEQEEEIEYEGVAFRFVPLKEYENQSQLSDWFDMVAVLHDTVNKISLSIELKELPSVPGQLVRHITLELLQIARFNNFLLLTSRLNHLLKTSPLVAGVVCEAEPGEYDLEACRDALFGSIKATEQAIDKHDIDPSNSSPKKRALREALLCGNLLILAYRIITCLALLKPFQKWTQIHKSKDLQSSEEFFIMLYELQLERMEESGL